MADILIRKIDEGTKQKLQRRAARRGKSLEADLRAALEALALDESISPDDAVPFGDWLVSISRPGFDVDGAANAWRVSRARKLPDFK